MIEDLQSDQKKVLIITKQVDDVHEELVAQQNDLNTVRDTLETSLPEGFDIGTVLQVASLLPKTSSDVKTLIQVVQVKQDVVSQTAETLANVRNVLKTLFYILYLFILSLLKK